MKAIYKQVQSEECGIRRGVLQLWQMLYKVRNEKDGLKMKSKFGI